MKPIIYYFITPICILETKHALIQINEQIQETIEKGKFRCRIFIDLRKAFDTVNHDILLRKLDNYSIRGYSQQWFKSYSTGRKKDLYHIANLKEIFCGVHQGLY